MKIFADKTEFVQTSLELIKQTSDESIARNNIFRIVLAGGNTPKDVYKELRNIETSWNAWRFYFGDERCLPKGHSDSNAKMAEETLLDHIPIQKKQVYKIQSYLGAREASIRYNETLKDVSGFDLVLLGLGEDGHTASLFPGNDLGEQDNSPDVLPVFNSPKSPAERITLSVRCLKRTSQIMFLVSGKEKKEILQKVLQTDNLPASKFKGDKTKIYYLE